MDPYADTAEQYRDFATHASDSPTFRDWSQQVAEEPDLLGWLGRLPRPKRQPNLVFAAARWHGVTAPGPYSALRSALLTDDGTIERTIRSRATQTNESGRMATLLPALALAVPTGPVALLEVGTSAGLCLYPDRWGYAWTTETGTVLLGDEPRLRCTVTGPAPLPAAPPQVTWRGGLDLHPLDVTDADARGWLENLVWPEHDDRREVLRTAVRIARADPPRLVAGDLLTGTPRLVQEAAAYGTVVVFHSAVIAYLAHDDRDRFDRMMRDLVADGACHWISNEGAGVLPEVAGTGPAAADGPDFVLGLDGRAVAHTHGHGRRLHWLG